MIKKIKKLFKKFFSEKQLIFLWHYPKAILASLFYNFPAKKLFVIGVAGTKGKTTTCHLISHILEKAGKKTAMFSTALLKIGEQEKLNNLKMTTPPPFFLQRFIKEAVGAGCQYLVLETSSHALEQGRIFGIPLKIVVLTNMMPDHLDYHRTAKAYSICHKKMLSRELQFLILNADDPNLNEFLKADFPFGKKIKYSLQESGAVIAKNILFNHQGSSFLVRTSKNSFQINLSLLGKFNLYNALASIAVGLSLNIDSEIIKKAVEEFRGAPGRVEQINCGQNFQVIVDYAHSPDSLNNLFKVFTCLKKGKVITLFGACGERDASQRQAMGKIIEQNSDYIIITNDDPYGEAPEKIAKEVMSGIKNKNSGRNFWKILDRKSAIKKAIFLAKSDDIVLILGKGAEQWQVFKNKKIPWDDREKVREVLQTLRH